MKNSEDVFKLIQEILKARGLHELGELIKGKIHILNISEEQPYEWKFNDITFRIYHSDGYCFDVQRHYVDSYENIDSGMLYKTDAGFAYEIFPEVWDGFKNKEPLSVQKCFDLLNELIN